MKVALRICALVLAMATAGRTADPAVEELYKQTREKVVDNARRMPRYTCVETIDRTQYPASAGSRLKCEFGASRGQLSLRDRLRLDVAVVDSGEIFSWAGARKFETQDIGKLVGGGASGSGEFGSFLAAVFGNAPDQIRYAGLRNDFATFEYNVPLARSSYQFRANGGAGRTIPFHGTFSVDPSDGDLHQLVVETDEFSQSDAVCRVRHVMDYSRVKIGGADFLLPEVSTMDGLYRNGAESLNQTHYSDCREYVGESTIHFDDVDAEGPAAAKAALQPLPPKVHLPIGLSKPIDTEIAAAGDEVEGVLLREVKDKRSGVLAKAGDKVHGRILRLQQYMEPAPRWFIAIRFDRIERNGVEQTISLKPLDDGNRSLTGRGAAFPRGALEKPEGAGLFVFDEHGNMVLDQKFHSEWETR